MFTSQAPPSQAKLADNRYFSAQAKVWLWSLQRWRAAWIWALLAVLGVRVGLGLVMGAARLAVKPYLPDDQFAKPMLEIGGWAYPYPLNLALDPWPRWDGIHYLALAQHDYFGVGEGDSVFYPLCPGLVRAAMPIFGGDSLAASLVISTAATVAALACLYRLAEVRSGSAAARLALAALALYPTAVFLIAPSPSPCF